MVDSLPSHREILRFNRFLPDHLRQCSVVLRFASPFPKPRCEHFYRVRLTQQMLAGGAETFWMPEVLQPGRAGKQKCLGCGRIAHRIGVLTTVCRNPSCGLSGVETVTGPQRGVVDVKTTFRSRHPDTGREVDVSFVVGREWSEVETETWLTAGSTKLAKQGVAVQGPEAMERAITARLGWPRDKVPTDMINGCVVVLDRQYREEVLAAVWRTCGELCESMGWEVQR